MYGFPPLEEHGHGKCQGLDQGYGNLDCARLDGGGDGTLGALGALGYEGNVQCHNSTSYADRCHIYAAVVDIVATGCGYSTVETPVLVKAAVRIFVAVAQQLPYTWRGVGIFLEQTSGRFPVAFELAVRKRSAHDNAYRKQPTTGLPSRQRHRRQL